MKILGVDPGTITMGYGVIESIDEEVTPVDYGAFRAPERSPIGERLCFLYRALMKVIVKYHPDILVVEQPFVSKNVKSALAVGRAQAVAMLAAANRGIPAFEYSPAEIKKRVANFGAGSKEQVQQMVALQLGLTEVPYPNDAADALAVALCHLQAVRVKSLLEEKEMI